MAKSAKDIFEIRFLKRPSKWSTVIAALEMLNWKLCFAEKKNKNYASNVCSCVLLKIAKETFINRQQY
jgi:hypothetical protein